MYKGQVASPRFPSLGGQFPEDVLTSVTGLFRKTKYSIYQQYTQVFQVKANLIQERVHIKPLQRGGRGKENGEQRKIQLPNKDRV